jgi:hypothetical protein
VAANPGEAQRRGRRARIAGGRGLGHAGAA